MEIADRRVKNYCEAVKHSPFLVRFAALVIGIMKQFSESHLGIEI